MIRTLLEAYDLTKTNRDLEREMDMRLRPMKSKDLSDLMSPTFSSPPLSIPALSSPLSTPSPFVKSVMSPRSDQTVSTVTPARSGVDQSDSVKSPLLTANPSTSAKIYFTSLLNPRSFPLKEVMAADRCHFYYQDSQSGKNIRSSHLLCNRTGFPLLYRSPDMDQVHF